MVKRSSLCGERVLNTWRNLNELEFTTFSKVVYSLEGEPCLAVGHGKGLRKAYEPRAYHYKHEVIKACLMLIIVFSSFHNFIAFLFIELKAPPPFSESRFISRRSGKKLRLCSFVLGLVWLRQINLYLQYFFYKIGNIFFELHV